jgi:hypothetical protein
MSSWLDRISRALRDPAWAAYNIRARLDASGMFARYARRARDRGFDQLYFVVSFDCDTPEDIRVVGSVHARLVDMGARPVYAVAGELLRQGASEYRRVMEAGGEFINHGNRQHTYFDAAAGEYASCFFYDQLPEAVVRKDILDGDAAVRQVLGVAPRGFRTPHFGTFQRPAHLALLHRTVRELGYAFSTSTVPIFAFRYGPVFHDLGVAEIPVSGMGSAPLAILDTWNCFCAPNRALGPEDYRREGAAAAKHFADAGIGLLNYYADPCHIHDSELFFETVRDWLAVARPVTYSELLDRVACTAAS